MHVLSSTPRRTAALMQKSDSGAVAYSPWLRVHKQYVYRNHHCLPELLEKALQYLWCDSILITSTAQLDSSNTEPQRRQCNSHNHRILSPQRMWPAVLFAERSLGRVVGSSSGEGDRTRQDTPVEGVEDTGLGILGEEGELLPHRAERRRLERRRPEEEEERTAPSDPRRHSRFGWEEGHLEGVVT